MDCRTMGALLAAAMLAACGGSIDKGPEKNAPSNANANNEVVNATPNADPGNNVVIIDTGNNNAGCLSVSPGSIDFGSARVGTQQSASITIENCSPDTELVLLSVNTAGDFGAGWPELALVQPHTTTTVDLFFAPTGPGTVSGDAVIETSVGQAVVTMVGSAIDDDGTCPFNDAAARVVGTSDWTTQLSTIPGTSVDLSAQFTEADDAIVGYEWSLISKPTFSDASLSGATTMEPSIYVDAAGTYEIEMRAIAGEGSEGCEPGYVRIDAVPTDDAETIRVELTWDTPGDLDQTDLNGTDLDLHYLHPSGTWNSAPFDCYWQNATADWGTEGTARVDIDDVDGAGPEAISHTNPAALLYDVGVYYYAENGYGPSTATVNIYRGQTRIGNVSRTLSSNSEFWWAGAVDASSDTWTSTGIVSNGFPTN